MNSETLTAGIYKAGLNILNAKGLIGSYCNFRQRLSFWDGIVVWSCFSYFPGFLFLGRLCFLIYKCFERVVLFVYYVFAWVTSLLLEIILLYIFSRFPSYLTVAWYIMVVYRQFQLSRHSYFVQQLWVRVLGICSVLVIFLLYFYGL